MTARIFIKYTLHISANDQRIRIGNQGDLGGQVVVIAKLKFFCGNRIVLIDDGQDPIIQQLAQGIFDIQITGTAGNILVG